MALGIVVGVALAWLLICDRAEIAHNRRCLEASMRAARERREQRR